MLVDDYPLDPRIERRFKDTLAEMRKRDDLDSEEQLNGYYSAFGSRFGPERLHHMEDQELLLEMHGRASKDCLVYWLEFKNDEEFPSSLFGSIGGGSAHKFKLYQREKDRVWIAGSPQAAHEVSTREAIDISAQQREQLIAGCRLLDGLAENAGDAEYAQLQTEMEKEVPDLSHLSWAHKYFSLYAPSKIDPIHNVRYQRMSIARLLQHPPETAGRYAVASRFVKLASHFQLSVITAYRVLWSMLGTPPRVWRIGTRVGNKSIWQAMQDGGFAAIGFPDLENLGVAQLTKNEIAERISDIYPQPTVATKRAGEILRFLTSINEGDLIVAAEDETILGVGRVTGTYEYRPDDLPTAPHMRSAEWLSSSQWKMPKSDGLQTIVYEIRKHVENRIALEDHLLDATGQPPEQTRPGKASVRQHLDPISVRIAGILSRKGQMILYGPPGTGKTFWARRTALDLAAFSVFGKAFSDLDQGENDRIMGRGKDPALFRWCTFHPAFGYEDFLEGYRPKKSDSGNLVFKRKSGVFKQLCKDAAKNPRINHYLLIDEINRGDIPRIFGEIITLLEKDKRGLTLTLPVSGKAFSIPSNVFVIGTMNTADRSIALLDTALRRRFGFLELMPDSSVLENVVIESSIYLSSWLDKLNARIRASIGRDARNLQVGHAYLLKDGAPVADLSSFRRILSEDIIPLLQEYCYEDYAALVQILGKGLVDVDKQRIKDELFKPERADDLIQALSELNPEMGTSTIAAEVLGETETADEIEEDFDE